MKILVTGGAGFIGRVLVSRLVKAGHAVRVFDNLSNASEPRAEGFDFVQGDIENTEEIRVAAKGMDAIVHLAAQILVDVALKNPVQDWNTNVLGTVNVLEACRSEKIKKLVYMSSAATYGDPSTFPILEETEARPLSPYGASKYSAEVYCRAYAQAFGLDCTIFRLFNAYGAGGEGVVWKYVQRAQAKEDLILFGEGTQTRDFVHVQDVAQALQLGVEKEIAGTYNLASGEETTIKRIAELVQKYANAPIEIVQKPGKPGEIARSVADIHKLKKSNAFTPKYTLEKGIQELLA